MSHLKFLKELKKRCLIFFGFFISVLLLTGVFSKKILAFVLNPNIIGNIKLVTLSPYENAFIVIYLIFIISITFSLPLLIYQIVTFIGSALTKKEKITLSIILIAFFPLFLLGATFGFILNKFIIIPFLSKLVIHAGISNSWSVIQFVKFFTTICLGMGVAFQMPLVIFFLVKTKILELDTIKKTRKYVFVGLIIFAALITPPDVFSLLIVTGPLFLLFEISILISKLIKN